MPIESISGQPGAAAYLPLRVIKTVVSSTARMATLGQLAAHEGLPNDSAIGVDSAVLEEPATGATSDEFAQIAAKLSAGDAATGSEQAAQIDVAESPVQAAVAEQVTAPAQGSAAEQGSAAGQVPTSGQGPGNSSIATQRAMLLLAQREAAIRFEAAYRDARDSAPGAGADIAAGPLDPGLGWSRVWVGEQTQVTNDEFGITRRVPAHYELHFDLASFGQAYVRTPAGSPFAAAFGANPVALHWSEQVVVDESRTVSIARTALHFTDPIGADWTVFEQPYSTGLQITHADWRSGHPIATEANPFRIELSADELRQAVAQPPVAGEPALASTLASTEERTGIDLLLNDPRHSAVIDSAGPASVVFDAPLAFDLIQRYGLMRAARMQQYSQAQQQLREHFVRSMLIAQNSAPPDPEPAYRTGVDPSAPTAPTAPPGWSLAVAVDLLGSDEAGAHYRTPAYRWRFDTAAYARWYGQQPDPEHQAFGALYAPGATEQFVAGLPTESGIGPSYTELRLANGLWHLDAHSLSLQRSDAVVGLDPNSVHLNHPNAIGFDPYSGLATPESNIATERDWLDDFGDLATAVVFAYVAVQTGGAAATSLGMTTAAGTLTSAGLISAGAIAGGLGSAMNGLANENFDWRNVLRAALSGAAGAGLAQIPVNGTTLAQLGIGSLPEGLGQSDVALRGLSLLGQSSLRGLLTAALGGQFSDGVKQAALQWVAAEVSRGVEVQIGALAQAGALTEAQTTVLRGVAQLAASAIRIAGSSGNPMQASAQDWLHSVLGQVGQSDAAAAQAQAVQARSQVQALEAEVAQALAAATQNATLNASSALMVTDSSGSAALAAPATTAAIGTTAMAALPLPDAAPGPVSGPLSGPLAAETTQDQPVARPRIASDYPPVNLDPVTGLALYSGPNGVELPLPSLSEDERIGLINQLASGRPLNSLQASQLAFANAVIRAQALTNGATEGRGMATDPNGNVRYFSLNRDNVIPTASGERVEAAPYYKTPEGSIVYLRPGQGVPEEVPQTLRGTARSLYYGDTLLGRDMGVPQQYAQAIAAANVNGGDPVAGLRMQVSVPTTGPFAELSRFIDPGSGQINPLLLEDFNNRAVQIAQESRLPIPIALTTNGMINSYQQALNNAALLTRGMGNAIVINVLNPTTGSSLWDTAEALQTIVLNRDQTVSVALRRQIEDALEFNARMSSEMPRGTDGSIGLVTRVISHSQGTGNTNQALSTLSSDARSNLAVTYLGTAVSTVPLGLGSMVNVTDRNDSVSTVFTGGSRAIENTFSNVDLYATALTGQVVTTPARIPVNYHSIQTNFHADTIPYLMPTGNNHSFYLYLMRPEVQQAMQLNLRVNPLPTYTDSGSLAPG